MRPLLRLFRAELIKWHWSWTLVTALLAPLTQTIFLGVLFWYSEGRVQRFRPGFRFWVELNYAAWNLVVMPMAAALLIDLSWGQERDARTWRLLLTQPVPRSAHYLVKFASHLALLWLAQLLFALELPAVGALLCRNPLLLMGPLPWGLFLGLAAFSGLATTAVASFQTWFSLRVPSLWAALAVAAVGSWATVRLVGSSPLVPFLPWGMAAHMSLVFERLRPLAWGSALGCLTAAGLFLGLGVLDFTRSGDAGRA